MEKSECIPLVLLHLSNHSKMMIMMYTQTVDNDDEIVMVMVSDISFLNK